MAVAEPEPEPEPEPRARLLEPTIRFLREGERPLTQLGRLGREADIPH